MDSISKLIASIAALIAALSFSYLVMRVTLPDGRPGLDIQANAVVSHLYP